MPEGGVRAGQEIQVPFPPVEESLAVEAGDSSGVQGRWKHDLCDCCEVCPGPFLMGWCCSGIMAGQVFQRMKYNFLGMPASGNDYQSTCLIMTCIFLVAWGLAVILAAVAPGGISVWYAFYIYIIIALTLARNNFRKKYNIPAQHCGESVLDDWYVHKYNCGGCIPIGRATNFLLLNLLVCHSCCAYWCGCCTLIQMHRHTHDEKSYPYEITSKTGLPENAPEIV